jgi:hypothetical protein
MRSLVSFDSLLVILGGCSVTCMRSLVSFDSFLVILGGSLVTGVLKLVTPLKVQNFQIFLLGTNFSRFPKNSWPFATNFLQLFGHKNHRFPIAKRSKSAIFFGALCAPIFLCY